MSESTSFDGKPSDAAAKDGQEPGEKDYLWLHLRELPYFRSLLRAIEARFYRDFELPGPVLDIGCGDGHFTSVTFEAPLDVGLDPWTEPIRQAAELEVYDILTQAEGSAMPYPNAYFGSAISNSVLEHIPQVEEVLKEAGRVLKPGALFLFCVPNHNFLASLAIGRWLDRLGLRSLGDAYRNFFNRIARHHHCNPPEIWQSRLEQAGFDLERWWHYYSPKAMQVSEWGHYFGVPSLVAHKLTGRWILSPSRWNLALTDRLLRPYYRENPVRQDGVCTFYVARRTGFSD
ncbi:class I SAM-dependent methyltransferase [Chloroflexota bacterium]